MMAFVRHFRLRQLKSLQKVQSGVNLINRRWLTLMKHKHEQKLFATQIRFSREVRTISTLLKHSGLHREAAITKQIADQIRCFSKSRTVLNRPDHNKGPDQDQDKHEKNEDDDDERKEAMELFKKAIARLTALSVLLIILASTLFSGDDTDTNGPYNRNLTWKEFYYDMLLKGEVERIEVMPDGKIIVYPHQGAVVRGEQTFHTRYVLKLPDGKDFKFEEKIREAERKLGIAPENGLSIHYIKLNAFETNLMNLLLTVLIMVVLFNIFSGMGGLRAAKTDSSIFESMTKARFTRVDSKNAMKRKITFKDVAGLQEAKVEVMEFVDYLKNPKRYKELGAKIPKGSLLLGPPGCGKTLLAKAVATEAGVPFLAMAGSEFVEMLGGLGASRVRSLFKEARKSAPCIIYIDEIDAIGRKRGSGMAGDTEEEHTLNQLLVEMDGMGTVEGVIMLASTNRADILDKALLRPGRFDRHIMIDFPTLEERKEMFEMYLRQLKLSQSATEFSFKLAQLTPRMTGADIANICNEAALHAAREKKGSIDVSDFDYAVERVIAGVAKKSTVLGPAEKKVVAYHESGHALVGWLLKNTDAILKISIMPRTSSALGFAQTAPSDRKLFSKEMLFEQICVGLGGRVAESLIFNRVTTGAQDDLKRITKIAYKQIKSFGMNDQIGLLSFPDDDEGFGSKPYSKKLASVIDGEAQSLIAQAYKQTEKLLTENKDKLHMLADELLKKEVITYDDVERLIGPPPHGPKNKIELNPLMDSK